MGCGSSSTNSYPRQAHPVATSYGQPPPGYGTAGTYNNGDGQMVDGMVLGYMAGSYMAGGGGGGLMPMGQDLPMGYHLGPTMPDHSVTVGGVDVL